LPFGGGLFIQASIFNQKGTTAMRIIVLASALGAMVLISACNGAKSPDKVAADTAKAEQKAEKQMSSTEDSVATDLNKAAANVDSEVANFNNTAAKDAYKLAVSQADGNRKITLAQCEAQAGDAQKACKEQADADFQAAKADAKAAAMSMKQ
jgi:hypothetical protein